MLSDFSAPTTSLRDTQIEINGEIFRVIDQGQGPAVLFAHGFPDTADTWRSQMQAVASAGYRAVAIDMRGFGGSYAPDEIDLYTSPYVVGDFVGVLDALKIKSATLVGHDWGADHTQRAMLMRPDRFHALVSLSIPYAPRGEVSLNDDLKKRGLGNRYYALAFGDAGAAERFTPARETIPRILYWLSRSPPRGTGWDPIDPARHMLRPSPVPVPDWADPDYVRRTISAFDRTGFETGLNYYRAVSKTFEIMVAFKNATIRQPSLYIWGAKDGLCQFFHGDNPTVEDFRAVQPGLVDVIRVENAGHWLQHEASDHVNAELVKFLDAHSPREV
jgi:pimeloyl-ACP methyl ester carboxylesterase